MALSVAARDQVGSEIISEFQRAREPRSDAAGRLYGRPIRRIRGRTTGASDTGLVLTEEHEPQLTIAAGEAGTIVTRVRTQNVAAADVTFDIDFTQHFRRQHGAAAVALMGRRHEEGWMFQGSAGVRVIPGDLQNTVVTGPDIQRPTLASGVAYYDGLAAAPSAVVSVSGNTNLRVSVTAFDLSALPDETGTDDALEWLIEIFLTRYNLPRLAPATV